MVVAAAGGPVALRLHLVVVVVVPRKSVTCVLRVKRRCHTVTSVRVANSLVYFLKHLVHFIMLQFADYYTYKLVDLLL